MPAVLPFPFRSADEFRSLCAQHLTSTVHDLRSRAVRLEAESAKASLSDLEAAAGIWAELASGELSKKTYTLASTLCAQAIGSREIQTGHLCDDTRSRMICVTSAPHLGLDAFRRFMHLRNIDYFTLIAPLRRALHQRPGWREYDFVHWVFLGDSCHLLYAWSEATQAVKGAIWYLQGQHGFSLHFIVPEDLISSSSGLLEQIVHYDRLLSAGT
jgi:hypothetical protein